MDEKMQKLEKITEDQKKYAVDLTVTLAVQEIADKLNMDTAKVLNDFVASDTGRLLYDESSKLWWDGPSYVADMYMAEKNMR